MLYIETLNLNRFNIHRFYLSPIKYMNQERTKVQICFTDHDDLKKYKSSIKAPYVSLYDSKTFEVIYYFPEGLYFNTKRHWMKGEKEYIVDGNFYRKEVREYWKPTDVPEKIKKKCKNIHWE